MPGTVQARAAGICTTIGSTTYPVPANATSGTFTVVGDGGGAGERCRRLRNAGIRRWSGRLRPVQLLLTGPLNGASGIGVTAEPTGGSAHPTTAPVMLLSFT
ncbi:MULTISPECIES: hypothetical protein [unclassified Kitasatospora]|uniref:hypothetical protein n=1 Tax=unclassified Kitasatospora TaxID=2633591 RepID=UPI00340A8B39